MMAVMYDKVTDMLGVAASLGHLCENIYSQQIVWMLHSSRLSGSTQSSVGAQVGGVLDILSLLYVGFLWVFQFPVTS